MAFGVGEEAVAGFGDRAVVADTGEDLLKGPAAAAAARTEASSRPTRTSTPTPYRGRDVIERLVGWLKERWRRLCTRFEKLAGSYLAMVKLAFIERCLQMAYA